MMLLATWTSSIDMVDGTVEREDELKSKMRSRVGEEEREKGEMEKK